MKYRNLFKIFVCLFTFSFFLQSYANNEDIFDLTPEENLKTPQIKKNNLVEKIQDYQQIQAQELDKHDDYDVNLIRNGEVINVTVYADQLFDANDTSLTEKGMELLKPIIQLSHNPGFYKIILVMHTDNTRTDDYAKNLTISRVNSVYDCFVKIGDVDFVVPYALGSKRPSRNNNSMENRRLNRRLEIYLIPYDGMIEQAKHGSININIPIKNK